MIGLPEDSDEFRDRLMAIRGGCRCQDPGAMPPCSACSTSANTSELEQIREEWEDEQYAERAEAERMGPLWGSW
jgi:hypothetical protein